MVWIILMLILVGENKVMPSLQEILKNIGDDEKIGVIVHLKEKPDFDKLKNLSPEEYVEFLKNFSENSQRRILNYLYQNKDKIYDLKSYWIFNGIYLKTTKDVIEEISKFDEVEYIIEDFEIKLENVNSFERFLTPEWNIIRVKADSCWMIGYTGKNIIVGHMDTGVDAFHPALEGKFEGHWYDAVNNQTFPYDDHGHGTFTMGIIIGGDGLGLFPDDIGVAPDAKFVSCKCFDQNGSTSASRIHTCFQKHGEWKANGVDIKAINNSWGATNTTSLEFWQDCLNLRNLKIVPVFAIGNNGPGSGTASTPGNFPIVIGVGVSDQNDNVPSYSSRGPAPNQYPWNDPVYWPRPDWNRTKPDIVAPGQNIRSSWPGGGYQYSTCTSTATPHVTGGILILFQKNPYLTFKKVYSLLLDYARRPSQGSPYPNNSYGWGILNIYQSLLHTPSPWETHDCGEITLVVSNMGVFGECSYPHGSLYHLYAGSFSIGTVMPYVIDRYYYDEDWIPIDGVYMYEPYPPFCEYSYASYSDSGGEEIKGIIVKQKGFTFSEENLRDFVIIEYILKNTSSQPVFGIYSGIFLDWDINHSNFADYGGTDSSRSMAYQYYGNIYMGSAILYPERGSPLIRNLSIIRNEEYVYPYLDLPDSIAIKFLNGTLSFPYADSASDLSTCISAGPFNINPGDSIKVAFAIAGGLSLDSLKEHIDSAYSRYLSIGFSERPSFDKEDLRIYPLISSGKIYVDYNFSYLIKGKISIYNVYGSKLKILNFEGKKGLKEIDLRDFASGIYFIEIKTPFLKKKNKFLILK
ncbi:MAG: S8 family serine peptidase [candidate division WOR-3 bacterium]